MSLGDKAIYASGAFFLATAIGGIGFIADTVIASYFRTQDLKDNLTATLKAYELAEKDKSEKQFQIDTFGFYIEDGKKFIPIDFTKSNPNP